MSQTYNVDVIGSACAATVHSEAIKNITRGRVTAANSSRDLDPAPLSAPHGGEIKVYHKED